METKKFISTVKGFKTRFSNNPNVELEKKSIESICEKIGGKLEAFSILKSSEEKLLLDYMRKVLGVVKTAHPVTFEDSPTKELSSDKSGKLYEIDTIKKTCRRVLKDFSEINVEELSLTEMSMTTYQRYLKDKFPGEGAQIKKGKLYFRGYRISCDSENGFMIEDSTKRYSVVDTPFEDIPTPKDLGDFFSVSKIEHTPEELHAAVERGKEALEKNKKTIEVVEEEKEVDFEKLRKKVLGTITGIREKKIVGFDPVTFLEMIPFKRWKRKVNALLKDWTARKIRYSKFLSLLEEVTELETFVIEEKNHRSSFVGTLLPNFTSVGNLVGNKIEVDSKLVDAVPFMVDYLLHYEPKAMQQLMRFASGEVTDYFLLKNPYHSDHKIEFNKKLLANTEYNARVITCLCESVGLVAPQDLLYDADLQVGDKILIFVDGEWKSKQVRSVEKGICINKEVGLLKLDKWIKLPTKDEK